MLNTLIETAHESDDAVRETQSQYLELYFHELVARERLAYCFSVAVDQDLLVELLTLFGSLAFYYSHLLWSIRPGKAIFSDSNPHDIFIFVRFLNRMFDEGVFFKNIRPDFSFHVCHFFELMGSANEGIRVLSSQESFILSLLIAIRTLADPTLEQFNLSALSSVCIALANSINPRIGHVFMKSQLNETWSRLTALLTDFSSLSPEHFDCIVALSSECLSSSFQFLQEQDQELAKTTLLGFFKSGFISFMRTVYKKQAALEIELPAQTKRMCDWLVDLSPK